MRFLLDQDVYAATARFLMKLGHDVIPVARIGLSRADDSELLGIAQEQNRIFVTRDRDFGGLVFVQGLGGGVIYLRIYYPQLSRRCIENLSASCNRMLRIRSKTSSKRITLEQSSLSLTQAMLFVEDVSKEVPHAS
jgi:predicted nuclease of predicted toxin-antitoxin system